MIVIIDQNGHTKGFEINYINLIRVVQWMIAAESYNTMMEEKELEEAKRLVNSRNISVKELKEFINSSSWSGRNGNVHVLEAGPLGPRNLLT